MIKTSPDGYNWTSRNSGTSKELRAILWDGTRLLVAGQSGTLLTSSDGVTWNSINTGSSHFFNALAYSGSTYLAVGGYGMIISGDGLNWKQPSAPPSPSFSFECATWNGSKFLAGGLSNKIYESADGETWTLNHTHSLGYAESMITVSGTTYVVGGNGFILETNGTSYLNSFPNPNGREYFMDVTYTGSEILVAGFNHNVFKSGSITPPTQTFVHFATTAASFTEGSGATKVNVSRTGITDSTFTVDYNFVDSTALNEIDFAGSAGSLQFSSGETVQEVLFDILDNTVENASKEFTIILSNTTNGAVLGSNLIQTVTIADDEGTLGIDEAIYGSENVSVDVKTLLESWITDNKLQVSISNGNMGGDPEFGKVKTLNLKYRWQGSLYENEVREGGFLDIPNPNDTKIHLADHNASVLVATNAGKVLGRAEVVATPGSYGLMSLADHNASVLVATNAGKVAGRTEVAATPSSYGLMSIADHNASVLAATNAGKVAGRAGVAATPGSYGLMNIADHNASVLAATNAGKVAGRAEVVATPRSYGLMGIVDHNSSVLAVTNEARVAGRAEVVATPDSYGLMSLADHNASVLVATDAGKVAGREEVVDAPRAFGLHPASDLNASVSGGLQQGIEGVLADPNAYGLFSGADLNASKESSRVAGIAVVTTSPGGYGLLRISDANASVAAAKTVGNLEVVENPAAFGLVQLSDFNSSVSQARENGINAVKQSPKDFGLLSHSDLNATVVAMDNVHQQELTRVADQAKADAIASVKANPAEHGLAPVEIMQSIGATPHTQDWYYQPEWGWMWTNEKTFPYVYSSSIVRGKSGWLYFREGSASPIYFYSYAEQAWITLRKPTEEEILKSIFD
jgi:hypothetical protein